MCTLLYYLFLHNKFPISLHKQQERLDIEEKYTSLQEEAQGKTKKLKKVWTMLMAAKSEVNLICKNYLLVNLVVGVVTACFPFQMFTHTWSFRSNTFYSLVTLDFAWGFFSIGFHLNWSVIIIIY